MHPRRPAVLILALALVSLLPAARLAGAQPGPRTPPPPSDVPPTADPPAPPASPPAPGSQPPPASSPPAWPPPADAGPALLTPPAVARDRLYIDAGLEAILLGDLRRAEALFSRAALEASTPELRATAALLAQRTAALADRRAQLPAPLAGQRAPLPRPRRPATARPVFLLTTTVLGVAAWGWTLPLALDVDDGDDARATVGLYMLTAAGSFIVPYMLTRSREVTWGQANMAFYGGTRGLEYGLLISNMLFGEDGGNIDDGTNERAFAASLLLGSISGVIAGSWWAGRSGMSAGEARTVAVWGDYGLFAGFVAGHVFGFDDLMGEFGQPRFDARARSMAASGAVGTVLGLTVGRQLSLARTNSWGDGEVMRGAGLLGVMAGITTAVGFDYDESSEGTLLTMAIGGGLGLAGGDLLVRNTNFSVGESILTDLALVSGGLGAAGLAYLITPDAGSTAYLLAGTLGAGVGGGLSYWVLRDNGTGRNRAAGPPSLALMPQLGRNGPAGLTLYGAF